MIRVIIRRFLEMFIPCAVYSAIAVVLNITGLITARNSVFILTLLGVIFWFFLNWYMLKCCYFALRNRKIYYISNFIAYAIFGICALVAYLCFSSAVYGWVFAIAKFLKYTKFAVSTFQSTVWFYLLGGFTIFLAPVGMDWIFLIDED